jgi:hypothetical protein
VLFSHFPFFPLPFEDEQSDPEIATVWTHQLGCQD